MTVAEVYILSAGDFKLWTDPRNCWTGEPPDNATRMFYLCQLGIWFYTAVSFRFFEARHKDYYVMYSHHLVTILLVGFSYLCDLTEIGVIVLFIHDFSDVFVDLLKCTNYLGLDMDTIGFPIVEIVFASNLVAWLVIRLYYYPVKAIYSAWFDSYAACRDHFSVPPSPDDPILSRVAAVLSKGSTHCNAMRIGLAALYCMHVFWFYLFCRIAYKLLRNVNPHDVGREEYEGASSESDVDDADKKRR